MASSSEAFRKFERWKKDKTPLKLTVVGSRDAPRMGRLLTVDEESFSLSLMEDFTRACIPADCGNAVFEVELTLER